MSFSVTQDEHGNRIVRTMLPVKDDDGNILIEAGEEIRITAEGRIVRVGTYVAHAFDNKDITVTISDPRQGGSVLIGIDPETWDALEEGPATETLILFKYRQALAQRKKL